MDESRQFSTGFSRWANENLLSPSMIALAVQCLLLVSIIFGDIGFDHPGRLGLDFNAFVAIGLAYLIALLVGIVCSISERSWGRTILQIVIPLAAFACQHQPPPRYDAAAYQSLRGKSKSEVETVLGTRGVITGYEADADGEREFVAYRGMTILYSPQGNVISVAPNTR